ncbi:MAG: hypothetical protein K2H01_01010 [Ruminococcus sp.]|nr:hypothetical protein [Ruminococcus sp.]
MKKLNLIFTAIIAVVSMGLFVGCGGSQEAKAVQEMIDKMPDTYSVDIDDEIFNVRTAFDSLSEDDKKYVKIEHLEELEEEYNKNVANEINDLIEKITISDDSASTMKKGRDDIDKVMKQIEKLPDSTNTLIAYDMLLKKVQSLSSSASTVLKNANDILLMEDLYDNINLINSAYSTSAKYGYACDIASDISGLSNKWSSKKGVLSKKAEELKDACLYKEDFEIAVSVLHVIEESSSLSDSIQSYYNPFLNGNIHTYIDDCLKWEQIIKENI